MKSGANANILRANLLWIVRRQPLVTSDSEKHTTARNSKPPCSRSGLGRSLSQAACTGDRLCPDNSVPTVQAARIRRGGAHQSPTHRSLRIQCGRSLEVSTEGGGHGRGLHLSSERHSLTPMLTNRWDQLVSCNPCMHALSPSRVWSLRVTPDLPLVFIVQ